jgi:cell division septation protein DedD
LPKNEDGEFELILGNSQLLSVFFIVVILLGVFFTMGYIVGRNSGTVTAEVNAPPNGDPRPLPEGSPAKSAVPAPIHAAPSSTATQTSETGEHQLDVPPEPGPPEHSKAEPSKAEPPRSTGFHPLAGQTYLQLAATNQHEADIMVDVLRKKSFRAMAAEIDEKPGTFRVLVGPVTDTNGNRMRADLQGSGFPGNAAIRRTF